MAKISKRVTRGHFTVVPNEILRGQQLSLRARGLWALLWSYPDNWTFNMDRLTATVPEGRDAVKTAMRELRSAGLVRLRMLPKDEKGRAMGWAYEVSDSPFDEGDKPEDEDDEPDAEGDEPGPQADFQSGRKEPIGMASLYKDCIQEDHTLKRENRSYPHVDKSVDNRGSAPFSEEEFSEEPLVIRAWKRTLKVSPPVEEWEAIAKEIPKSAIPRLRVVLKEWRSAGYPIYQWRMILDRFRKKEATRLEKEAEDQERRLNRPGRRKRGTQPLSELLP